MARAAPRAIMRGPRFTGDTLASRLAYVVLGALVGLVAVTTLLPAAVEDHRSATPALSIIGLGLPASDASKGIDQQIAKAENAVAGQVAAKRNRFVQLTSATKTINPEPGGPKPAPWPG
jgi:lysophospholipase L1-like esterase